MNNQDHENFKHGYWIYQEGSETWWRGLSRGTTTDLNEAYVYSLEELQAIKQDRPGFAGPETDLVFVPALPLRFDALEGLNDIVEHVGGRLQAWLQEQEKAEARKRAVV